MTTESRVWVYPGNTIPTSETNKHDQHSRGDDKDVQKISALLDRMVAIATGPKGLVRDSRSIDKFDLDGPRGIQRPSSHLPGNIHVALFKDALWLAGTTGGLPAHEHRLTIYGESDVRLYQMTPLHADAKPGIAEPISGVEAMIAASEDLQADMGQLLGALEIDQRARWRRQVTMTALNYALKR